MQTDFIFKPWPAVQAQAGAVEFLLDRVLIRYGLSAIIALPKGGKSTTARCLTAKVAGVGDNRFLGFEVRRGKVLYVSLEAPPAVQTAHFQQLGVSADNLLLCTQLETAPSKPLRIAALEKAIQAHRPALVVLDTMARVLSVPDDNWNQYGPVGGAMQALIDMTAQYKTHIMLVTHAAKGSADSGRSNHITPLGSAAIDGSVDTTLILQTIDGKRVLSSRQNAGEALDKLIVSDLDANGMIHAIGTQYEAERRTNEQRLYQWLTEQDGFVSNAAIGRGVRMNAQARSQALNKLVEDGLAERETRGNAHYYRAFPEPEFISSGSRSIGEPEQNGLDAGKRSLLPGVP